MPSGRPKRVREGCEGEGPERLPPVDETQALGRDRPVATSADGSQRHQTRAENGVPLPSTTRGGVRREATREAERPRSPRHADTPLSALPPSVTFGYYVWTEISMVLFYRFMKEIQSSAVALALAASNVTEQQRRLQAFAENMQVIWAVGRRHMTEVERDTHDGPVKRFTDELVEAFRSALGSPFGDEAEEHASKESGAALREADGHTSTSAAARTIDTCRALERVLDESGFPDDEGSGDGTVTGGLAQLVAATRLESELCCYSYSPRASPMLPLLPRYEGEKRPEADYAVPRAGHTVELPIPHPHPEVCTSVQLMEPKRRRPPLDEYRIFSHPKKTVTHGVEDFMVDEELHHRALVVLRHHLDSHGSFKGLLPYARFLLWSVVLDRDEAAFEKVHEQSPTTVEARRRLEETRVALGAQYAAFTAVRAAAREAAQAIGWYAVSAQWRDQALARLEDGEESDWYCLGDVSRRGTSAVFPNYAATKAVRAMALRVIEKLDRHHATRGAHRDVDEAVPASVVVHALLMPLLLGRQPELAGVDVCGGAAGATRSARYRRRLRGLMARRPSATAVGNGVTPTVGSGGVSSSDGHAAGEVAASRSGRKYLFLLPSLIFPLQCLGELLELCSLAEYAEAGARAFSAHLLAADWADEEGVLRFLLHHEPLSPGIAPMAALPKVYRDLVMGVQLLMADRMLPAMVETARVAAERGLVYESDRRHLCAKALTALLQEEGRTDDLILLSVVSTPPDSVAGSETDPRAGSRRVEVGQPLYTEAFLERARRVWPEDLEELEEEERAYRARHELA